MRLFFLLIPMSFPNRAASITLLPSIEKGGSVSK
jgi:hypothetical protein